MSAEQYVAAKNMKKEAGREILVQSQTSNLGIKVKIDYICQAGMLIQKNMESEFQQWTRADKVYAYQMLPCPHQIFQ